MSHPMRLDALRSAAEAAGVAMAPSDDQFDESSAPLLVDVDLQTSWPVAAGAYVRSWAAPVPGTGVINWLTVRWPRALST